MKDLERYEAVNKCETLKELAEVIRSFADDNDEIQGRSIKLNASNMVRVCEDPSLLVTFPNFLTRQWGIRQQAMYIMYYDQYITINHDML